MEKCYVPTVKRQPNVLCHFVKYCMLTESSERCTQQCLCCVDKCVVVLVRRP